VSQFGHLRSSAVPHDMQKRAPSGFSAPHARQVTPAM
jgi:hypothetical protein